MSLLLLFAGPLEIPDAPPPAGFGPIPGGVAAVGALTGSVGDTEDPSGVTAGPSGLGGRASTDDPASGSVTPGGLAGKVTIH